MRPKCVDEWIKLSQISLWGETMGKDPLPNISVVIVTYNFAMYLRECVESVLAQTLQPFEIIICDDHSLDGSRKIIKDYGERYPNIIRGYSHERNIGVGRNGNFGLKRAKGGLITYIDGDDRWLPRKLEMEWKALDRYPKARVAYSNVYRIDAEGNRTGIWHDAKAPVPPSGDVFVEVFSRRFFQNTSSIFKCPLMYRSALHETGYCDESLESYWDWDHKIRLTARYPVVYSGQALVEYRRHEGGFSRSEPEKHLRAMAMVYEKHLPLLSERSRREETLVRCGIESLLAFEQIRLLSSDRLSYYCARRVYDRNRALFDQLPGRDRRVLETEVSPIFRQLAQQASMEEIEKGNRSLALGYWMKSLRYGPKGFNRRLLARIFLPWRVYSQLEVAHHAFRKIRR